MTLVDYAIQYGLSPKWAASTEGGEYHSHCPICGGKDRFRIQPLKRQQKCDGVYSCRQCKVHGDTIKFMTQFLNYSFQEALALVGNGAIIEKQAFRIPDAFKPAKLNYPPEVWISHAIRFIEESTDRLLDNKTELEYLEKRGINEDDVRRYGLGWVDRDYFLDRKEWGLEPALNEFGEPRCLWIPKGILIPTIENGGLGLPVRLKVRRANHKQGDKYPKYIAISGSMNGLNVIGNIHRPDVIIVESELDAIAIDAVMGHSFCAIAVGAALKNPDVITDGLCKNARNLLVCHDNDRAGKDMLGKWRRLYTKSVAYPVQYHKDMGEFPNETYKDVGEAIERGFPYIKWLQRIIDMSKIPDNYEQTRQMDSEES